MNDQYVNIIFALLKDQRTTSAQLAIYLAILVLYQMRGDSNQVNVSRREVMQLAKINSFYTYHKAIYSLVKFNYINYYPSYHPGKKTLIVFVL